MTEIVGRHDELASIRAFVRGVGAPPIGLILEGEAGIGKSALWLAGVEEARAVGLRVLEARPTESEHALGDVGLSDLLDGVVDEVLPSLLSPRRRALEVALLRRDAGQDPVDARTVAVAVRDALEALSNDRPTLIAVDDVQWLDRSTANALSFALRRLDASPVALLLTRRVDAQPAPDVQTALADRVKTIPIGPLSVGALHQFLRDRARVLPRQTLLRVHEYSGGNPFVALEIARILPDSLDPLAPLPVPGGIEDLVAARLEALPRDVRQALAVLAAAGAASEDLIERAGIDHGAIEAAVAAHVVARVGGLLRFTHPLLSSVLYSRLAGTRRRSVHAQLAQVADDAVVRARHLGHSIDEPDEQIAGLLDAAAELAARRGAIAVGAELAELALRVTARGDEKAVARRALVAARTQTTAGEWTRARAIAMDLLAQTADPSVRAECLLVLSEFEHDELALPTLEEALHHAADSPRLSAQIQIRLGWAQRFSRGFPAALEVTRRGLALADELADDHLRYEALVILHTLGTPVGDQAVPGYADRARRVAHAIGDPRRETEAGLLSAVTLMPTRAAERDRRRLEDEYIRWHTRDEMFSADLLGDLSWLEFSAGLWARAAEHAAAARSVHLQYGVERNQDYIPMAWIAAHRGQDADALAASDRGLELAEGQIGFHPPLLKAVRGIVALPRGGAAIAAEHLEAADRTARTLGWGAPDARPWTADYVEALLQVGRVADAGEVIEEWDASATRIPHAGVSACILRCRGLVAAALGDVRAATTRLREAVERHTSTVDTFGRARASLGLGVVLRRDRQKRAAREALADAAAGFEALGATAWLERAAAESGRLGGRAPGDGLSSAERRVAALVAEGRTNHEVAAALFLTERTVASHLTRVYAKLGVRSRTELARKFQTF